MKTKSLVAGIILSVALVAPFAASALSIDDLQQQIKNLLAQIATLQVQYKQQVASSSPPAEARMTNAPRICGLLNRNLSRGQNGDDVRGLQEFLTSEGFLNASATGFFGPATASALAKWQTSEGVSGVGSVGPLTREHIKIRCGNQYGFKVSPQTGSAPLNVTAYANVGGHTIYRYAIDFGDGSTRQSVACNAPADACIEAGQVAHTYTADGTYTVSLWRTTGDSNTDATVLAKESVRVGSIAPSENRLSADPQTGSAPLNVTFTTSIGINDATPSVDFGDGASSVMTKGSCVGITAIVGGQGGIRCAMTVTHTYSQNGSYTAKLIGTSNTSTGWATITVGNDDFSSGTLTADPQSGGAPLPVSFTYHPATDDTSTYWIDFGDGNGQQMDVHQIYCIKAPCISPSVSAHTYTTAGTYTAYVTKYIGCMHTNPRCMIATLPLAKTVVTVTGNGGGNAPVISGFSGPTSLSVNEIGTWKITASDPENGPLQYSVLWGDEWTAADASIKSIASQASIQQDTTFTHSYSRSGSYTVALTVTDATGLTARTTGTVQVAQTACTTEYAPVCARPNGCANTCAAGQYCTMQCQLYAPQTYSNRCQMNNSNATFMHEGACTGNEGYLQ